MKMAHVTIMSKCIDESVEFYQQVVGLQIVRDMRGTDHSIVFLCGEEGGTCVEIVDEPGAAFAGSGISIGFPVDDVAQTRAALEAQGLCPGPMISPNPHVKFFFVHDPNGVGVQFLQEM